MTSGLIDSYGRAVEYLRLSVTDRCNLRCFYCMPDRYRCFSRKHNWLHPDELIRLVAAFTALGVSRLRLTGGEPLLRRDLAALAGRLSQLPGLRDLSLSTNGLLLAKQASTLRRAGIARINVSLDTLRSQRFTAITRGGHLGRVLDGLMEAQAAGYDSIKINMLALKGINDDEFEDMLGFCVAHGFILRLIEPMPVGDPGRQGARHYLDLQEVKERLSRTYRLTPSVLSGGGPARYYRIHGTSAHIGFISAMSRHFCQSCNRVRLSPQGTLYLCLGQDDRVDLAPLVRRGASDAELKQAVLEAVARKPEGHEFCERPERIIRFMSATGG